MSVQTGGNLGSLQNRQAIFGNNQKYTDRTLRHLIILQEYVGKQIFKQDGKYMTKVHRNL